MGRGDALRCGGGCFVGFDILWIYGLNYLRGFFVDMRYRRAKIKGGTYFFTVATYKRAKFLCEEENVQLLRESFKKVMAKYPFKIDAFVLLPDHSHCIWTLPPDDFDFSTRWKLIKSNFSRKCNDVYKQQKISLSRRNKNEQAVWQRRFWEHSIRDEKDFKNHVEYIHYNPVKHCLTDAPKRWEFSSFHRYVKTGKYAHNWCADNEMCFNDIRCMNGQAC